MSEELEEEEQITAARHWLLPSGSSPTHLVIPCSIVLVEFQGLWESLVFDCDVKEKVMYIFQCAIILYERNSRNIRAI